MGGRGDDLTQLGEDRSGPTPPSRRGEIVCERGDAVGRYVVVAPLGAGGMGMVFAAYDPELDRKVALKLLHAHQGAEPRRLLREAQALARLSHPNVVGIHDVGVHEGRVFLAMEFVEGQTLRAWLEAADRGYQEILDMFVPAARGLAAAHEQGLVHRDFKPENVMVGVDGRVRVMDFGLARPEGDEPAVESPTAEVAVPRLDALNSALTEHGSVVGTPAYMAPEQHLGLSTDARTDQFSYCLSLWEALYGERPFAGETLAMLAVAVTEGKIREPSGRRRVPGWLRRACQRGLAPEPADRFASMEALLGVFARGRNRARRRVAITAAAGLLVVGVGAEAWRRADLAREVDACEQAGREIDAIWNDETRGRLRAALADTGVPDAGPTAERVISRIDAHANSWAAARTQTCLDGGPRRVWDAELTDRSTWCLEQHALQLATLVEQLTRSDADMVASSVAAAARILPPDSCRDEVQLRRVAPPDRDHAQALSEVWGGLYRADALLWTGKFDESLTLAQAVAERAAVLDAPDVSSAAGQRVGRALSRLGRYEEAARVIADAYFEAARAGAWHEALPAAVHLVSISGLLATHSAQGELWFRHSEIALAATGQGEDSLAFADALHGLAVIRRGEGRFEEALAAELRSVEIREARLGPEHPDTAVALNTLGNIYYAQRDLPAARAVFERALAIREAVFGGEDPLVAMTLNNLASVHLVQDDLAGAQRLHERALGIREHALGPEHPEVAASLTNLTNLEMELGLLDQARAHGERALAIYEKTLGPEHPELTAALTNVGLVAQKQRDFAGAERSFARALAVRERLYGPRHADVAAALLNLARLYARTDRSAEALPLLERSAEFHDATVDGSPLQQGMTRFELAQALIATHGDRARALDQARRAREVYREAGEGYDVDRTDVEAWLAAQGD